MKTDNKYTKKRNHVSITTKEFVGSLTTKQKRSLSSLINSSQPKKLRKTVYTSSGGKYGKYQDFVRSFVYQLGYVPIHPLSTLGYYLSSIAHNNDKAEIVKDCYSLMVSSDEMWVFDEKLPGFGVKNDPNTKHISDFPEGVLAEIFYWLTYKKNSPLRFFTWADIGIAKYQSTNWSLVPNGESKKIDSDMALQRFGILDLGSSTVKLSVCQVDDNKNIEVLDKKAVTVNLAEGFFKDEMLKQKAVDRTIEAILDLQQSALTFGVVDIKLVGTGVIRKAKNIDEFIKQVKTRSGLELEVLKGHDEARLIFKAVSASFDSRFRNLAVINAGGGSTEIILGNQDKIEEIYTLPLGISDLIDKYTKNYPVGIKKYEEMKNHIIKILEKKIGRRSKRSTLVYTGGELDYMLVTGFSLENYSYSLAHPKQTDVETFKKKAKKMSLMKQEELHAYMPSNPLWMNGAIASNAILESIAEYLKIKTIIPSNKNLNDGILLNLIE